MSMAYLCSDRNCKVMMSLAGGCGLMLAILVQYIRTRKQLGAFHVDYGRSGSHQASIPFSQDHKRRKTLRGGIYDRWLMTRFSIAFVVLRYGFFPRAHPYTM